MTPRVLAAFAVFALLAEHPAAALRQATRAANLTSRLARERR